MATILGTFFFLSLMLWAVKLTFRIFALIFSALFVSRPHSTYKQNSETYRPFSERLSAPVHTRTYPPRSYEERPPWGTERYVQYYCIYNMRDQMNSWAKNRCFNPAASPYEAYTDAKRWLILNQLHDEYVSRFPVPVSKDRLYGSKTVSDRMATLRADYEAELAHLTLIRNNLKSYFEAHPHGLRKDAVKAFVRKSDNQAEYYLYYRVLTSFEQAHVLITRHRKDAIEYTYVGSAMSAILGIMRTAPSGLQNDLLNQLCPKKTESPLNRRSYTYTLSHMQKLNMITLSKDDAGFVHYQLLSSVPRPVKLGTQANELVSYIQNTADDYLLRKALFTINAPAVLDRQQGYAAFVSLRDLTLYHTSLQACTCPAFDGSKTPCKHMVRLALDLNLVHFSGEQRRFHGLPTLGYSDEWFTQFM